MYAKALGRVPTSEEKARLIALLGSKEAVVAALIFASGFFYFPLLFVMRAVSIGEVRAAFRRERGPAAAGLPGGLDA